MKQQKLKSELELNKPKSWLKTVSAFYNCNGGTIIWGINDETHEVIGINNESEKLDKITELINSRIIPIPVYNLDIKIIQNKKIIILNINKGINTPYYYSSDNTMEAFLRKGNSSLRARNYKLNYLVIKSKNLTFDYLPSNNQFDEVSFTSLKATYKKNWIKEKWILGNHHKKINMTFKISV